MKKADVTGKPEHKLTHNYDGRPLEPGEVLVPMVHDDLFIEHNVTNTENIKFVKINGVKKKVVYTAVPVEWAQDAKGQLNLEMNEELGHYSVPNSISMDAASDDYDWDLASTASVEDEVMRKEESRDNLEFLRQLVMKAPKLGYAVLLTLDGVKGEEFYERMHLSRTAASRIQQMAKDILKEGVANFDLDKFVLYRSKLDTTYVEEALALLDLLIEEYLH